LFFESHYIAIPARQQLVFCKLLGYADDMPKRYDQDCPVAKTLELVGERWTLLIVRDLLVEARRFQDLEESLEGIAPNILSERLRLLEEHGIVRRKLYSKHPPRAAYALSRRGEELGQVVAALAIWGSRHVHKKVGLVHAACGERVEMRLHCPKCGRRVRGVTVRRRRA
jgi:DNA-binding HxlR family transcriptional regulator